MPSLVSRVASDDFDRDCTNCIQIGAVAAIPTGGSKREFRCSKALSVYQCLVAQCDSVNTLFIKAS